MYDWIWRRKARHFCSSKPVSSTMFCTLILGVAKLGQCCINQPGNGCKGRAAFENQWLIGKFLRIGVGQTYWKGIYLTHDQNRKTGGNWWVFAHLDALGRELRPWRRALGGFQMLRAADHWAGSSSELPHKAGETSTVGSPLGFFKHRDALTVPLSAYFFS